MTRLNPVTPHSSTGGRPRARGATHSPGREARARRSFDAVLASYIRELSTADDSPPRPRARS